MRTLNIILFALVLTTGALFGQEGKFSGLFYGDYYNNIQNHDESIKGKNGFWFRRIYFTYDYNINKSFSTRLRLEMGDDGKFTSSKTYVPFVKDAYLQYKFGKQKVKFGISPPPTFNVIEKIWGYRSIEKTALDLQRMASSRDFGLSLSGELDNAGNLKYHVMMANGSGNKQEIDKGKAYMASVGYWFTKNIVLELYGDYAERAEKASTYISQGFLGYKSKNIHGGIQYSKQTLLSKDDNTEDINLNVLSIFLSGQILKNIKLIGRVDRMFNANPAGDNIAYTPYDTSAPFTMYLAGVDFSVAKNISLIPNITYVSYNENENGVTPNSDLYGKMTFFWRFN